LAISAFAFAGAAFFKEAILKNVLDMSKSFTKDDLVRQNEIFEDIAADISIKLCYNQILNKELQNGFFNKPYYKYQQTMLQS
jgi:hypothetical protein